MRIQLIPVLTLLAAGYSAAATVSPLAARGYAALPEPRKIELRSGDFRFGPAWRLELGSGVEKGSVAADALREDLESRFHFALGMDTRATGTVRLEIARGSVTPGDAVDRDRDAIAAQAYRLELAPNRIQIRANAQQGLFYGVETLVQLLRKRDGALWLPEGNIEDWPDLEMRQLYWDDAHHLERMDALKHAVRQAAFFKINGFALKLEGHFQYRSVPALVEPYALSPAEFQELTDYGLRYFVQIIPYLDGPGHIAFILKHPEYSNIREYPDSNYEFCVTNPDSYKLLFGMFDDLLAANKGVKFFYLSTDEPYYVGLADNSQCHEAARAKELGSVGKLLAEFVTKAGDYLHDRGRRVVFWGEYPMKPDDVALLPKHVVNGEVYGEKFDTALKEHGIQQMIYTSIEGEERMFPDYFALPRSRTLHTQRSEGIRVPSSMAKVSFDPARRYADLIGMFVAGWADPGVHPDTFWMGYAAATAAGWNPSSPDPNEAMSAFYSLFFGPEASSMNRVYQLLSWQAQIWSDSWESVDSKSRKGIWGNSNRVYPERRPAHDQSLPLPPAMGPGFTYSSTWSQDNARRLDQAATSLTESDELLGLLLANLPRAEWNRYSMEVMISIAQICRQNLEFVAGIGSLDRGLAGAADAAKRQNTRQAITQIDRTLDMARAMRDRRNQVYRDTVETWYKSWLPRVAEANGRRFLHEVDDVKDHLPDRTVDMSYLVMRELQLPLDEWYEKVQAARNEYASAHGLPARSEPLDWKRLE